MRNYFLLSNFSAMKLFSQSNMFYSWITEAYYSVLPNSNNSFQKLYPFALPLSLGTPQSKSFSFKYRSYINIWSQLSSIFVVLILKVNTSSFFNYSSYQGDLRPFLIIGLLLWIYPGLAVLPSNKLKLKDILWFVWGTVGLFQFWNAIIYIPITLKHVSKEELYPIASIPTLYLYNYSLSPKSKILHSRGPETMSWKCLMLSNKISSTCEK